MARPRFAPDPDQQRILKALTRQPDLIAAADARLTQLIAEAHDAGVPIEHIARATNLAVKTVYNRLARSADTDPRPTVPPSAP